MQNELNKIIDSEVDTEKCNNKNMTETEKFVATKQKLFNIAVLVFTFVMTIAGVVTFFVSLTNGAISIYTSYYIASTYVLVMLLAAPTLKVFLDKCTSKTIRRLNVFTLVAVFIAFAFPQLFNGY